MDRSLQDMCQSRTSQAEAKQFGNLVHEMDSELAAHLGGNFLPIKFVLLGQYEALKPGTGRSQNFLFDATTTQDSAAKTDLARHAEIGLRETLCEKRCQSDD